MRPSARHLAAIGLLLSMALLLLSHLGSLPKTWISGGPLEAWAVVLSVWWVWLEASASPWNWPLGIISSALYGVIFYQQQLVANSVLQIYFVVVSALGWYWWLFGGKERTELPISRTTTKVWTLVIVGSAGLSWGYMALSRHLGGQPIFLDILTTALSVAGEIMISRKLLENWWVWIVANSLYVVMFWSQRLPFTAGLFGLFLIVSFVGLRNWLRIVRLTSARS